jgi:hypothetical protein
MSTSSLFRRARLRMETLVASASRFELAVAGAAALAAPPVERRFGASVDIGTCACAFGGSLLARPAALAEAIAPLGLGLVGRCHVNLPFPAVARRMSAEWGCAPCGREERSDAGMTGRQAALLPRRSVIPADQPDARAEEGEKAASEDDGPGRALDDEQANDDQHGGKDEPRPCSGLEDGHDDLPSRQLARSGQPCADRIPRDGRLQVMLVCGNGEPAARRCSRAKPLDHMEVVVWPGR